MKKAIGLIALGVVVMMPLGAAKAHAFVPVKSERIDAKRFARDWWAQRDWRYGDGRPDCYGVRFVWRSYSGDMARVPSRNDCVIVFNSRINWNYLPKHGGGICGGGYAQPRCHEWGHLRGMPYNWRNPPTHSHSPNNIMASSEPLSTRSWWWPYFPGCRFDGDGLG